MIIICYDWNLGSILCSDKPIKTVYAKLWYINPLLPKRPSVDVFRLFLLKWRCYFHQIFLMKLLNDRWIFFYQLLLIIRSEEKRLICEKKNTEDWFDPKKIFLTFLCWNDLRMFLKVKKNFFQICEKSAFSFLRLTRQPLILKF